MTGFVINNIIVIIILAISATFTPLLVMFSKEKPVVFVIQCLGGSLGRLDGWMDGNCIMVGQLYDDHFVSLFCTTDI